MAQKVSNTKATRALSAGQQAKNWERASGRTTTPIHFPENTGGSDVGSRTMPDPAPVSRHTNSAQFGSLTQPDYSGPRSMLPGGYGSVKPPIDRSPKSMTTSMHPGGGAATGNNAVPSFAPTQGTVLTVSPQKQSRMGGIGSKLAGLLGGKGSVGSKMYLRRNRGLKASPHAGKNAANLKAATGAK